MRGPRLTSRAVALPLTVNGIDELRELIGKPIGPGQPPCSSRLPTAPRRRCDGPHMGATPLYAPAGSVASCVDSVTAAPGDRGSVRAFDDMAGRAETSLRRND